MRRIFGRRRARRWAGTRAASPSDASLRGKWPIAILIGLVAVLLGGAGSGGPEVKFNYDASSGVSTTFGYGGQTIYSTGYGLDPKWSGLLVGGVVYLIVIALVLARQHRGRGVCQI